MAVPLCGAAPQFDNASNGTIMSQVSGHVSALSHNRKQHPQWMLHAASGNAAKLRWFALVHSPRTSTPLVRVC